MTYNFPIRSSFDEAVKFTKALSRSRAAGPMLVATTHLINFLLSIPFGLSKYAIDLCTDPISMMYSNLPGPKKNFNWDGVTIKQVGGILPTCGTSVSGMMIISMMGKSCLTFITCKDYISHPDEFMSIFNRKI
jgi:hypothetical protein